MRTARLRWLPVTHGGASDVAGIAQVFGPGQLAQTSVMRPAGNCARSSHGRTASSPAATTIRPFSTGRCLISSRRMTAAWSAGSQPSPHTASVG